MYQNIFAIFTSLIKILQLFKNYCQNYVIWCHANPQFNLPCLFVCKLNHSFNGNIGVNFQKPYHAVSCFQHAACLIFSSFQEICLHVMTKLLWWVVPFKFMTRESNNFHIYTASMYLLLGIGFFWTLHPLERFKLVRQHLYVDKKDLVKYGWNMKKCL